MNVGASARQAELDKLHAEIERLRDENKSLAEKTIKALEMWRDAKRLEAHLDQANQLDMARIREIERLRAEVLEWKGRWDDVASGHSNVPPKERAG
jgi:hypothetical protein